MQSTRDAYLSGLKVAAGASLTVAALLYALTPARWFSFYGWAIAVLAAVVLLSRPLLNRLADLGRRRAWALIFIVPAAALGLIQIGFWLAYFHVVPGNPVPGVLRELFWINAGFAVPYALAAMATLWLWLFWLAARNAP